jgi:carbon monoxide dehydrogenase subunit G
MPGATVDSFDGEVISGKIKVKVGPVQMTYAGTARFTERDEATKTVVLEASGKETRGSGTAAATVRSSLQDEAGQTRVLVRTTMTVTGRPAQFGRGVMAEVGGRIIGKFASNLAAQLSGEGTTAQAAGSGAATAGEAAGATASSATASGSTSSGTTASGTTGASTAATQAPAPPASGTGSDASAVDGPSADPAQLPIEELGLPVRSFNSLRREGVHTVGGLAARTEKELLAIDGLGPQSVKEIKTKLADRGLALSTPGVTSEEAAAGTASSAPATAATSATSPAASTGGPAGTWDAGAPSTDRPAANGLLPPRSARPQDEDALDLLSVAGLPLLKRFGPVLGALVLAGVLLGIVRRRRRGSRT